VVNSTSATLPHLSFSSRTRGLIFLSFPFDRKQSRASSIPIFVYYPFSTSRTMRRLPPQSSFPYVVDVGMQTRGCWKWCCYSFRDFILCSDSPNSKVKGHLFPLALLSCRDRLLLFPSLVRKFLDPSFFLDPFALFFCAMPTKRQELWRPSNCLVHSFLREMMTTFHPSSLLPFGPLSIGFQTGITLLHFPFLQKNPCFGPLLRI